MKKSSSTLKFERKINNIIFYNSDKKYPVFARWAKLKAVGKRKKRLDDGKTLIWDIGEEAGAVYDHIEMTGFHSSLVLSYGKNAKGDAKYLRHVVFPEIRLDPNHTHAHLRYNYKPLIKMFLDSTRVVGEKVKEVYYNAGTVFECDFMGGAKLTRSFYPAVNFPAVIEKIEITNLTKDKVDFSAKEFGKRVNTKIIKPAVLLNRPIEIGTRLVDANGDFRSAKVAPIEKTLVPNGTATVYIVYYAIFAGESINFNTEKEIKERTKLHDTTAFCPSLDIGDKNIEAMFAYSLARGSESIMATNRGLLHHPGGGHYYATIWANDQCEYANPFFPFSGYRYGIEQAINGYRLYADFVNNGKKAPCSIITGSPELIVWSADDSFDRGDTEMFAYGLARFLLATGNKELATEFYPALKNAVKFILNKKSADGVIFSKSDELEGRFPTGEFNLNTNCLAYDALIHISYISDELGYLDDSENYKTAAAELKEAILKYFRGNVEGYDTYRYYKDNDKLRSWICTPSVTGITDAAEATFDAIFSDKLFKDDSLCCASDSKTVWDRALLYALRGAFITKYKKARDILKQYCDARLFGAHSPYPYEAYPEGNRRQLAAESILFARVITEGVFGLEPKGFTKLKIAPAEKARITSLYYGQTKFDIDNTKGDTVIRIGSRMYPSEGKTVFDFAKNAWED